MDAVYRQDIVQLDGTGFDPVTGFFHGKATLARVGVFPYVQADGTTRYEFVPPETLFDAAWLQSLAGSPITLGHPDQLVNKDNVGTLMVGATGDAIRQVDGRLLEATITVHRKDALDAIQSGTREMSCGYTTVLVPRSGVYQGQHYDAVQTRRKANHNAIVDRGRHGPEVRIKLDGAAGMAALDARQDGQQRGGSMATVQLGRYTVDVGDAAAAQTISRHLDDLAAERTALVQERDAHKARADKAEGERDQFKADADKVKADADKAGPDLEKRVRARIDLEHRAAKVLGDGAKFDGKSDDEVRGDVLRKLDAKFDATGRSGEYIAGRFDTALEAFEQKNSPAANVRRDVAPSQGGGGGEVQMDSAQLRAAAVQIGRLRAAGVNVDQLLKARGQ